jgi:hypothetical protein
MNFPVQLCNSGVSDGGGAGVGRQRLQGSQSQANLATPPSGSQKSKTTFESVSFSLFCGLNLLQRFKYLYLAFSQLFIINLRENRAF